MAVEAAAAGGRGPLQASAGLVETCLLRAWPGNVRELLSEVGAAAVEVASRGQKTVKAADLDPMAGRPLEACGAEHVAPALHRGEDHLDRERVSEALAAAAGNVSGAARDLGIDRSKLRRLMLRYRLEM
jgi:transcriptional regulator with GAF, ATPase, and Fis domain